MEDSIQLTFKDKMELMRNEHPIYKITKDSGWVSFKEEEYERTVEFTDDSGHYRVKVSCVGDPYSDPGSCWERIPDSIKAFSGMPRPKDKRKFWVHIQEHVIFRIGEIWDDSPEEILRKWKTDEDFRDQLMESCDDKESDQYEKILRIGEGRETLYRAGKE